MRSWNHPGALSGVLRGGMMIAAVILLCLAAGCVGVPAAPPTTAPLPFPTPTAASARPAKATISGIVIGGGDKSPAGLQGGPRTFIYEVRDEAGTIILVTYTAFPPSPAAKKRAFRLDFHAGQIQIGDYLTAYGSFDPATLTINVADEGDYIQTYPTKP